MIKILFTVVVLTVQLSLAASTWEGTIRTSERMKHKWPTMTKITFSEVFILARNQNKGEPLEVKLDEEHGFLVYEVTVIDSSGVKTDMIVDSGTGKILSSHHDD